MVRTTSIGAAFLASVIPFLGGCGRQSQTQNWPPSPSSPFTQELEPNRGRLLVIPFQIPQFGQNMEDKGEFFLLRRDKEKGFIYLTSERSTQGIANHLMLHHGYDPESAREAVDDVDSITLDFNEEARTKQQVEINFRDIRKAKTPSNINWTTLTNEELSNLIKEFNILNPLLKDYLDTPEKVFEFGTCDGVISPLSVISPRGLMQEHGGPYKIPLQKGMDIVPGSVEEIWYVDRKTHSLRKGIGLKVSEKAGRFGPGGENYLILPIPRTVIITDTRMYLIGFDIGIDGGEIQEEAFDENNQVPDREIKEPDVKGPDFPDGLKAGSLQMI